MRPPVAPPPPSVNDPRRGRTMRFGVFLVGVLMVSLASFVAVPASAQSPEEEAQHAAQEIQAARDRANVAAEAFFRARSDLELLEEEADDLAAEAEVLDKKVERLRSDVEAVALARFASSGSIGIPLLTGLQAPKIQVQAEVFGGIVSDIGSNALDEFDFAKKELLAKRRQLVDRKTEVAQQKTLFTELQEAAEAEVDRLRQVEEERLTSVAVQRALDAQLEASISQLEETYIQNAETAKQARPNPAIAAAAEAVAAAEEAAEAEGTDLDGSSVDLGPVETIAPNTGASGGSSGGRTGTGGAGSSPTAILTDSGYVDVIACPLEGSAYGDTWGAPRSGGRRHEGVDMLAPAGSPIIAVTNGMAIFRPNPLGGNSVSSRVRGHEPAGRRRRSHRVQRRFWQCDWRSPPPLPDTSGWWPRGEPDTVGPRRWLLINGNVWLRCGPG